MLSRFLNTIRFNPSIGLIVVFISTFCISVLNVNPDLQLVHIGRLYFSQATLDGVDINARIKLFYKLTFEFVILVTFLYLLLFHFFTRIINRSKSIFLIVILSCVGLVFSALQLFWSSFNFVTNLIAVSIGLVSVVFYFISDHIHFSLDSILVRWFSTLKESISHIQTKFYKKTSIPLTWKYIFPVLFMSYASSIIVARLLSLQAESFLLKEFNIGVFSISLPMFFLIFRYFNSKIKLKQHEINQFAVIGVTGVSLGISSFVGVRCVDAILFLFYLELFLFFIVMNARRYKERRLITNSTFLSTVFAVSFLLMHVFVFVLDYLHYSFHYKIVFFFALSSILLLMLNAILISKRNLFRVIQKCSRLLLFLPFAIFILSEMIVSDRSYRNILVGILILTGLVYLSLLFVFGRKRRLNSTSLLKNYLLPAVLISFTLQVNYHPFVSLPSDFYELANIANAQMRMFKFHEIPCLDFMSSHMFSEQYYGLIYHTIYGYNGTLDFLSYSFLDNILLILVLYVFCNRIFNSPILSAFFVLFFPYYLTFFNESMIYLSILMYSIYQVMKESNLRNLLLLFSLLIFSVFWKLDIGSAGIFTCFLFIPLLYFSERKIFQWKVWIKASFVFSIILVSLSVLLMQIYSFDYLYLQFQNALHYISANLAHGYSIIWNDKDYWSLFFYFVLPFISVISCIGIVMFKRIHSSSLNTSTYFLNSSLFFFLVVVMNFQRGLVRHNLIEMNESFIATTFYLACTLLLLSMFNSRMKSAKYAFVFLTAISLITILSKNGIPIEDSLFQRFIQSGNSVEGGLQRSDDLHGRVHFPSEIVPIAFTQLNHFLSSHFTAKQTFLDFSNSPMLYYFTQRKIPSYFSQSLQNTIDDFTQLHQIKNLNTKDVPVVIYSNYPTNWYDATDGVPNPMRYHLLAEYIYSNYKPFGIIDHKSIWIAKNLNISNAGFQQDEIVNEVQQLDYKKAAIAVHTYFEASGRTSARKLLNLNIDSDSTQTILNWNDNSIQRKKAVYLRLKFNKGVKDSVRILITSSNSIKAEIKFDTDNMHDSYMVPISNLHSWHYVDSLQIKIQLKSEMQLKSAEFIQDVSAINNSDK